MWAVGALGTLQTGGVVGKAAAPVLWCTMGLCWLWLEAEGAPPAGTPPVQVAMEACPAQEALAALGQEALVELVLPVALVLGPR
jgi:hypothetical protein